jgi:hypothetical protein
MSTITPAGAPRHRFLTWPSTRTGTRAAWVSLAVVALFAFDALLAAAGAYDWPLGARLVLGISGGLSIVGALAALGLTLQALRKGDRSIVLLWPLLLGSFAVLFVVGEFAFPH